MLSWAVLGIGNGINLALDAYRARAHFRRGP
jgi:hypothetical protein